MLKQQEYGMNKQVTHLFVIPLEVLINLKKINKSFQKLTFLSAGICSLVYNSVLNQLSVSTFFPPLCLNPLNIASVLL